MGWSEESRPDEPFKTLFHAFPRRSLGEQEQDDQRGLAILRSIFEHGLLIVPEVVKWQLTFSMEPTYTAQKRVCFTALERHDFAEHAQQFGSFAVGFDRELLERAGATPVFYVPRHLPDQGKGRNIGSFYIEKLTQLQLFLRNNPKSFRIGDTPVNTEELAAFTSFLSGLFYPIEEIGADRSRQYFAQHEWRILANLFQGKRPLSRPLTDSEKHPIASLDEEFFLRKVRLANGEYTLIDQCALVHELNERPLHQCITHLVAPSSSKSDVEALLSEFGVAPRVLWQAEG